MSNTGELQITVKNRKGKTVPDYTYFKGALKLMRPQYLDDSNTLSYMILNPGGGYVDGDHYQMDIQLPKETKMVLTTQSATKIYRTPKTGVTQYAKMKVAADSCLVNVPDPIIPYANSIYEQKQDVFLEKNAKFFTSEIITTGWDPEGGDFAYQYVNLLNRVYLDNKLQVMDRLYLNPNEQEVLDLGMQEGRLKVGSLMVINPEVTEESIVDLRSQLKETFPDVHFGITELSISGYSIRMLNNDTQVLENLIRYCYEEFLGLNHDHKTPWLRKY